MRNAALVERNQKAQLTVQITTWMFSGALDQYSTGAQQAAILTSYQDQVRAIGLAAWRKSDEGPTGSLTAVIDQKPTEDLNLLIDRVQKSMQRKFPLGDL